MPIKRDIVVIGGSAGAIDALTNIVRGLPKDFGGHAFVVQHLPPSSPSNLPEMLTKAGPLRAVHAKDGEVIQPGCIYVAPPDHHLLLEKEKDCGKAGTERKPIPSLG